MMSESVSDSTMAVEAAHACIVDAMRDVRYRADVAPDAICLDCALPDWGKPEDLRILKCENI